jgi:DNA-binding NarL/FixJ family response regulator
LSGIKIVIYSGQKEKSLVKAVNELGVEGYLIKGELMPKEIIAFTEKIHGENK